ncbi:hypothetical protein OG440_23740 [Streptomyces sp. NBC_00637]|uniref:hypothetical protein n=1 Tax=Streptomyces sp. NBC_00637 TaxID=2903667 RepID=UPI00325599D5
MPTETTNGHRTAGKLRAALWVLRHLGTPEAKAPDVQRFRRKKVPVELVGDGLRTLARDLLLARSRGGERWRAAVEVFREIPDFLQAALPGSTMDPAEEAAFIAGFQEQLTHYKERFDVLPR